MTDADFQGSFSTKLTSIYCVFDSVNFIVDVYSCVKKSSRHLSTHLYFCLLYKQQTHYSRPVSNIYAIVRDDPNNLKIGMNYHTFPIYILLTHFEDGHTNL